MKDRKNYSSDKSYSVWLETILVHCLQKESVTRELQTATEAVSPSLGLVSAVYSLDQGTVDLGAACACTHTQAISVHTHTSYKRAHTHKL